MFIYIYKHWYIFKYMSHVIMIILCIHSEWKKKKVKELISKELISKELKKYFLTKKFCILCIHSEWKKKRVKEKCEHIIYFIEDKSVIFKNLKLKHLNYLTFRKRLFFLNKIEFPKWPFKKIFLTTLLI